MKYRYRTDEEMKDSGVEWIGKIPNSWNIIKGKYLFLNSKIKNTGKIDNLLSLTLKGVVDRDINNVEGLQPENFDGYQEFYPDNLVFKLIDLENISTSRVGYVHKKGLMSPAYIRLEKIQDIYTKFYYYNYFCYYKKNIFNFLGSVGVRSSLNSSDLLEMNVVANEKKEQEIIANFLDEKVSQFDSIILKKEALIEKLEEAKKSLISEVVTGKVKIVKTEEGYDVVPRSSEEMKDSGVEWLGLVPKEWDVKRLRFLGTLQNGISKSSEEFGYGFPFVSYGDVYRNMNLPESVSGLVNSSVTDRKIYSVKQGDVFFTRTSETIDEIGISSVCLETIPEATFAGFLIRFRPNNKLLFKGFSKYYFRCILNRNYFVKEMNLVTRASLSQNLLNNLSVVLPTYEEQENIYWGLEYKIGTINNIIEKIKSEIQKLKEAKQSLITEAVTGKIEILD
ncbi:restriction endonuclease subunit S [Inconstantimicrobium porci]|uniref:Restriction endonuclease subunit S n=1 Tax=Inconstantimicrobium porci TaxID=2652291 RepID=A0A7X2MYQ7_9CLOT|nr:restriction endonuclease subunit S [Inconstantimicrobium porci]MSR91543.1 restriction endonuclease subunit S [Inconstantimicrobium porci]